MLSFLDGSAGSLLLSHAPVRSLIPRSSIFNYHSGSPSARPLYNDTEPKSSVKQERMGLAGRYRSIEIRGLFKPSRSRRLSCLWIYSTERILSRDEVSIYLDSTGVTKVSISLRYISLELSLRRCSDGTGALDSRLHSVGFLSFRCWRTGMKDRETLQYSEHQPSSTHYWPSLTPHSCIKV